MTKCTHDRLDKDVAVDADGFCPLCMAAEMDALRARIADLEARPAPPDEYRRGVEDALRAAKGSDWTRNGVCFAIRALLAEGK